MSKHSGVLTRFLSIINFFTVAEGRAGHTTLAGPVAADSPVAEHLSVHGGDGALSILVTVDKCGRGGVVVSVSCWR